MTAPQPQPGCGFGCGQILGGFLLVVLALWFFGNACAPAPSSTVPSPSRPVPVEQQPYMESLCEGTDYLVYDDCKRY